MTAEECPAMEEEGGHGPLANGQDQLKRCKRALELFQKVKAEGRPLNVSAPMVRYSKLPFRLLVKDYDADMYFTPMILAHEFVRSQAARESDFSTCEEECDKSHALIAQFAASEPLEFARAAEMIAPWVDGVDLNCGCPQSWALKEGLGCSLMENPELVAKMVVAAKQRMPTSRSISCKIRIHKDVDETIQFVQILVNAGVDFITVHGRTRAQRSTTAPDYAAIKTLKQCVSIPVIANGDCYNLMGVSDIASKTGADGIMAARGILENPALFNGSMRTPVDCVTRLLRHCVRCPIPFPLVLHHIAEMTTRMPGMAKIERKALMACHDLLDLIDFVDEKWGLEAPN